MVDLIEIKGVPFHKKGFADFRSEDSFVSFVDKNKKAKRFPESMDGSKVWKELNKGFGLDSKDSKKKKD